MKKILLTLLAFLLLSGVALAQQSDNIENDLVIDTNTSETSSQYFNIELKKGVQNPITKKIPFKIVITPKINSSKTQILWNVPTVFTVTKNHSEFVSLIRDQTYTYSALLKPNKEGSYNISVNVVSWQTDSNKSNSADTNITLNKSLIVSPIETMYIVYILLIVLLVAGIAALIIFLLSKGIKLLVKKAKVWFTPPY